MSGYSDRARAREKVQRLGALIETGDVLLYDAAAVLRDARP
ncbi:MAG: hypothetical protein ACHQ7N_00870 [Candidatus Methylomirabilales bacterium]